jgi:primosomal protein N' (replication factor Y)
MLCHLCGYEEPVPERCPTCGNHGIVQRGVGSQKLEKFATENFPEARMARIDSDTAANKNNFRNVLSDFRDGKIDVLIGTQMIAKGLDFPNVSLVGIVDIDGTINFPDFRSAERAFQLIIQVSGRTGRSDKPGHVIVQTRDPQSPVIQLARKYRFQEFMSRELGNRSEFTYPPYRHIIRIALASGSEDIAKTHSAELQSLIKQLVPSVGIREPVPAILAKINGKFRYTIVIFSEKPSQDSTRIAEIIRAFKHPKALDIAVDVDPVDLV